MIIVFQFQYGSIRSLRFQPPCRDFSKFQFQYGSIRRATCPLIAVSSRNCFNSSMVRLEAYHKSAFTTSSAVFQFQYGSIRSDHPMVQRLMIQMFQFQYGSIRRIIRVNHSKQQQTFQFQYGSIRRLQDYTDSIHQAVFQFQYGSIRRLWEAQTFEEIMGFNSSMVRLEDGLALPGVFLITAFQFQYGSIRRKHNESRNRNTSIVSIPVWFD